MLTFNALGLSEEILQGVVSAGYATPTPIQAAAIPVACAGRDVLGCAQTGTGKTAAFVLPMLDRLSQRLHSPGPRMTRGLVVVPTRELAQQVGESVQTYGAHTHVRCQTVFGGVPMGPQIQRLKRTPDIIVATPGRLLDVLDRRVIDLSRVEVLVLDEADRMFDMGFIHDIRRIVAAVPKKRQTLLFSATMPKAVQELANTVLTDPEFIEIGERRNPAETIRQQVCSVATEQKMDLLFHVLDTEDVEQVLVFSRTKHRADKIHKKLEQQGFSATVLHSNRSQSQRLRALEGFKNGRFRILVATDIAARGIDVDGISHVVNFDTPNQPEDYIHRIGRTGRAQTTGDAITFAARDEEGYVRDIERHIGKRLTRKVYDGFEPAVRVSDAAPAHHRTAKHAPKPSGQPTKAAYPHRNGGPGPGGPNRRDENRGYQRSRKG